MNFKKRLMVWVGILFCLPAFCLPTRMAFGQTRELRGIWISDPTALHWESVIAHVKKAKLNTLFVNFASAGVAFYPSRYLPEKKLKEPLSKLIRLAKKEGIAVHAKLLTFFMYWAPKEHQYEMIDANRVQRNTKGKAHLQADTPWLDPALPENRTLIKNVITEILETFDVEGFQLDYIRYYEEHGVPPSIMQIRQATVTQFISDVREDIFKKYPHRRYSACIFYDLYRAKNEMGQDWETWAKEDLFTFLVPMNYTTSLSHFHRWVRFQGQIIKGRMTLYPGLGAYMDQMTPSLLDKQMTILRNADIPGFILFSYNDQFIKRMLPFLASKGS